MPYAHADAHFAKTCRGIRLCMCWSEVSPYPGFLFHGVKMRYLAGLLAALAMTSGCALVGAVADVASSSGSGDTKNYFGCNEVGVSEEFGSCVRDYERIQSEEYSENDKKVIAKAAKEAGLHGMDCNQAVFYAKMDLNEQLYGRMIDHCSKNYSGRFEKCRAAAFKIVQQHRNGSPYMYMECTFRGASRTEDYVPASDEEFRTATYQKWYNEIPEDIRNEVGVVPVRDLANWSLHYGVKNQLKFESHLARMDKVEVEDPATEAFVKNKYNEIVPDVQVLRVVPERRWETVRDAKGTNQYKKMTLSVYVKSNLDYDSIVPKVVSDVATSYRPKTENTILRLKPIEVRQMYKNGAFQAPTIELSDDFIKGMTQLYNPEYYEIVALDSFQAKRQGASDVTLSDKKLSASQINAQDSDGKTPLFHYVSEGNTEDIQLLLDNGADVNVVDNSGKTALFYVKPEYKKVKSDGSNSYTPPSIIVGQLAKAGIDVNHRDKDNFTAVDYALVRNEKSIYKDLITKENAEANLKPLLDQFQKTLKASFANEKLRADALKDLSSTVEYLVSAKVVSPNGLSDDKCQMTYLMHVADMYSLASSSDSVRYLDNIVRALIRRGVEVNAKTPSGSTALDYLPASAKKAEKALVDAGATKGKAPTCRLAK